MRRRRRRRVSEVIPGFREGNRELLEAYGRVAATGVADTLETYVPQLDAWFKVSVHSPAPGRFVAVFDVITARKRAERALRESEERYRSLVEHLTDVVYALDADGIVTYASNAVTRFGYAPADVVGQPFGRFIHPDDLPGLLVGFAETLAGRPVAQEFRLLGRDGKAYFVRSTGRPTIVGGLTVGVAGVLIDLTEQRQTEEQLRQAQKMEAVGRLAGGIAHDFNNLLAVILSYVSFALDAIHPGDPLHEDLAEVRDAGERAALLTRQLLAFSRRQVLQPEVLNLNAVVARLSTMLRRLIGEDIELRTEGAPDLGNVKVDPGQIEQVVMNLVVNARDAMPRGGVLTIQTSNVVLDRAGGAGAARAVPHVLLEVKDTGCGMGAEVQARLFEPFFTTKGPGKGTGLGLATAYGIVKQSGGEIRVASTEGQGTSVSVYLPLEPGVAAAAPPPPEAPARAATGETILVVEDEAAVRNVTRRVLAAAGYEVLTAANGGEALLLCERHQGNIDLVLTDVIMPIMSGKDLATRLQAIAPRLRVLFMSGYTDDTILDHGVLEPGTHFIGKPFGAAELTRKVREVLDDGPRREQ